MAKVKKRELGGHKSLIAGEIYEINTLPKETVRPGYLVYDKNVGNGTWYFRDETGAIVPLLFGMFEDPKKAAFTVTSPSGQTAFTLPAVLKAGDIVFIDGAPFEDYSGEGTTTLTTNYAISQGSRLIWKQ